MRRRLLRSTLLISVLIVIALGVPLAIIARHQVWSSARDSLRQQAASVAAGLEDRLDNGQAVDLTRYAELTRGRRIVVASSAGAVSSAPQLRGPTMQAVVHVSDSSVTVQALQRPALVRARETTLLITGIGLIAVVGAVLMAVSQAKRLSAPLADLARRADALGRGEFTPAPVISGIQEIDHISSELERSATHLATMITLQREFASDAAHQLRTPLTGIGLRLEEVTTIGDVAVQAEADDALIQVDRLNRVISALLARARGDAADPTPVDVGRLVQKETPTWERMFAEDARELHTDLAAGARVWARHEHLSSILSCLLDNGLRHGAGTVRVLVEKHGSVVKLSVSDDGPGVPAEIADRIFERRISGRDGTGIGLALARSLAAAEDGTLEYVAHDQWTRFVLTLNAMPAPTEPAEDAP